MRLEARFEPANGVVGWQRFAIPFFELHQRYLFPKRPGKTYDFFGLICPWNRDFRATLKTPSVVDKLISALLYHGQNLLARSQSW